MAQIDGKTHRQPSRLTEMGKQTERHDGKQKDRRKKMGKQKARRMGRQMNR